MVLQDLLTENEIDLIFDALEKREKFWRSIANRSIIGYGKATEFQKKQDAADKAKNISTLLSKLVDITN